MKREAVKPGGMFFGWWIVAVSMIGISTGPAPLLLGSLGVFMKPLSREFGWNRAEISACVTVFTIVLACCLPLVGRLIDRFGSRRVLLPSMGFLALFLAAVPVLVTHYWQFLALFVVLGVLGAGTNTVSYMPLISAWFDRHRGLAIGISMSGIGLGFAYVPVLVQSAIERFGWGAGYYALAGVVALVAMPMVWLWLRDTPASMGLAPDGVRTPPGDVEAARASGLSTADAMRTSEFWMLAATFVGLSFLLNGIVAHLVPMLTDRGMAASTAALAASTLGVTVLFSRIAIGYLVDRLFAPHVAVFFFSLSALGVAILALGSAGPLAFVAAMLVGLSLGAELDFVAFLTGRYFGLRAFGTNYGILLAGIVLGAGTAPLAFAVGFERAGNYTAVLMLSFAINTVAVIITSRLGPYPDWSRPGTLGD